MSFIPPIISQSKRSRDYSIPRPDGRGSKLGTVRSNRLSGRSIERRNGDTDIVLQAENPRRAAAICKTCPLGPRWEKDGTSKQYDVGSRMGYFTCEGINPEDGRAVFSASAYNAIPNRFGGGHHYMSSTFGTTTEFDDRVAQDARCGIAPGGVAKRSGGKLEVEV